MQPAIFDDGQVLSSTHYHVDACFWKTDTFIDGATFLVPSKAPEASFGCYSVDLDEVTGVHHVTLRKASLRRTLQLTNLSKPGFSSHVVEFSNGEMTVVPRVKCARGIVRQIQYGILEFNNEVEDDEPVRDQVADKQTRLIAPSRSTSQDPILTGTSSTLTKLVSSIHESKSITIQVPNQHTSHLTSSGSLPAKLSPERTAAISRAPDITAKESGCIGGQQAADDRSSLAECSESVIHLVPRLATASTFTVAEGSNATTQSEEPRDAQSEEPIENADDFQSRDSSRTSRRSSAESQGNGTSTSMVPTTPTSLTFSALPFWKSTLANLPKIEIAPGKPTCVIEALALEEPRNDDRPKIDDLDNTILRRLSWNLCISKKQIQHWDKIQDSESPCIEDVSAPAIYPAETEEGGTTVAEDASNNVQSSLPSLQLVSKPAKALQSFYANMIYVSQQFDALDVVRIELMEQKHSQLSYLDLVPESKGKQPAVDARKSQQFLPVPDGIESEIATDSASGKLYLRPKITIPEMVIQSILAGPGTNIATGADVPAQDQSSSDSTGCPARLEDIDLTAEFDQGATDLDDEGVYSAPSTIDYHIIGGRLAKTRNIPSEYADYVEHMVQAQPFIPRILVEANEYWNFIKATTDSTWHAQGCPNGFLPRRRLRENDSDAVFRELLDLGSKPETLGEKPQNLRVEPPVHHFNLIDQPVYQDSRNPSAVSYWAAMASFGKQQIEDGVSWKAVVSSQAAKWVDPCTLDRGVEIPDNLHSRENSTALRDFLTGQTTIHYMPYGTWISDRYDADQEIPEIMSAEVHEGLLTSSSASNLFQGLQRPYFISKNDNDVNVNDDGTATVLTSQKLKGERTWESLKSRGFTNLRLADNGTRRVYCFKNMEESRVCEVFEKYESAGVLVTDLPFKAKPETGVEGGSNLPDAGKVEDRSSEATIDIGGELAVDLETTNYPDTSTSLMVTKSQAAEKPIKKSTQESVVKEASGVAEKGAEGLDESQAPIPLKSFFVDDLPEGIVALNDNSMSSRLLSPTVGGRNSDDVSVAA